MQRVCYSFALLIACTSVLNTTGSDTHDGTEPTLLPDGVLVMNGGETRSHIATWTVLVTIDRPAEEVELHDKLKQFRNVLHSHHQLNALSNVTREIWEERIQQIETTMLASTPTNTRMRRGLLNVFGEISRKLFGTATEKQVQETRRRINSVSTINRKIIHLTNHLVSIVNQTHGQVRQHQRHIHSIEQYLTLVKREIHIIKHKMRTSVADIEVLKSTVEVERILSAVEAAHNSWLRQVDKHQRQRASLELGWLTEEILPVNELRQIITTSKKDNLHAPSTEWYYSHVRILPLWEEGRRLVFKAELPLTNDMHYLRYYIWTWPIPVESSKYNVRLQVPTDVAVNTKTGGLFEPTACQGHRPSICRTGPVYDRTRLRCPRGIIIGDDSLRKQCTVVVSKVKTTATVQELTPGTLVIYTTGETYSLYCDGHAERRVSLKKGLYVIRLNSTCWIHGDGWTVTGLIRHSSDIYSGLPIIQIPPMNLPRTIRKKSVIRHFESLHWDALGKITDIEIATMNDTTDDSDDMSWTSNSGQWSWAIAPMTTGLVIVLICLFYYRECVRKLCFNQQCKNSQNDAPTSIEMTTVDNDAPTPTVENAETAVNATPPAWRVLMRNDER